MQSIRALALACAVCVLSITSSARAVPVLLMPDFALLPETANQSITLTVSGDTDIRCFNLVMDIGGGSSGPRITAVDIIGLSGIPTVFTPNNTGDQKFGAGVLPDRTVAKSVTTDSGSVPGNGNLVSITLDTTGIAPGQYQYRLSEVPNVGSSDFGPDRLTGELIAFMLSYAHPAPNDPNRPGVTLGFSLLTIPGIVEPSPGPITGNNAGLGPTSGTEQSLPEPGSIVMLALGLGAFGYYAVCTRRTA